MIIKELKHEIKELKKLKLQLRPGSKERIEIHRKIKELKKELSIKVNLLFQRVKESNKCYNERRDIILELTKLDKLSALVIKADNSFWDKYNTEQLKEHLLKIKSKRS